jgi:hypothetical protein
MGYGRQDDRFCNKAQANPNRSIGCFMRIQEVLLMTLLWSCMPVEAQQGQTAANEKSEAIGVSVLVEQEGPGALFAQAIYPKPKSTNCDRLSSLK